MPLHLTSDEAATALGVKRTTLYSYVSRGLIRTMSGPDGRQRRYLAADVEALRARSSAAKGHQAAAAGAVDWGAPVLDSSITSIDVEGPNYRGHSAIALAERGASFEAVAHLLWTGVLEPEGPPFDAGDLGVDLRSVSQLIPDGLHALGVLSLLVPAWAATAEPHAWTSPGSLADARVLIRRMAAAFAWLGPPDGRADRMGAALAAPTVAQAVSLAMGAPVETAPLADLALVLCADHELNASSFAARVAASTGADLHASVQAALCTLSGPRHGRASDQVEALLDEAEAHPGDAAAWLEACLQNGVALAGFGHRLYADGDPRAQLLLERSEARCARGALLRAVVRAAEALGHPAPTLDVGLVALRLAAGWPRGSGAALFALGRTAGWVAHAREQAERGQLIRPRARYVGP